MGNTMTGHGTRGTLPVQKVTCWQTERVPLSGIAIITVSDRCVVRIRRRCGGPDAAHNDHVPAVRSSHERRV